MWPSMENLSFWIFSFLAVAFMLKFVCHQFRYRTNRNYRYEADMASQFNEFSRLCQFQESDHLIA